MLPRESKPSSWFTISSMVRCTSLSPPAPSSNRAPPMASICGKRQTSDTSAATGVCSRAATSKFSRLFSCLLSYKSGYHQAQTVNDDSGVTSSKKMRQAFLERAIWNSSRTMRAPSPTYFCTSSLPMTRMKQASVRFATARASSVLPVPAPQRLAEVRHAVMHAHCCGGGHQASAFIAGWQQQRQQVLARAKAGASSRRAISRHSRELQSA